MKKILLLTLIGLLFHPLSTKASHGVGGEITWHCLSNGQYEFRMTVYRHCAGIPWVFQNENISIIGAPLPTNGVSSIVIQPDQGSLMLRNGDTSPECTNNYGSALTCANNDLGTIQRFQYFSNPITLTGVPPAGGWDFMWQAACCRSGLIENLNASGAFLLRATMYPTINNDLVDSCFDSSPQFADLPQTLLCRGQEITYNHVVLDLDRDSIVYKWGRPINSPITSPVLVPYNAGYSYNNPTPDVSFGAQNIPSSLNAETGDVTFRVTSGTGTKLYTKVHEVEAWREGKIIAKVAREIPFAMADCPLLPNGNVNNQPIFSIIPSSTSNLSVDANGIYRDTVIAGGLLDYLISVRDADTTGGTVGLQEVTLVPFGQSFSINFSDSAQCSFPGDSSCATLSPAPSHNQPNLRYQLSGFAGLGAQFKWRTNCTHLKNDTAALTHYFHFKYFDDHCGVPAINYQTLAITILPSTQPCSLLTNIENTEPHFRDAIRLYPNPTNGKVKISLKRPTQELTLVVRNLQGKLVKQETYRGLREIELELENTPGIYFLTLTNEFGETANSKVVKQ